MTPDSYDELKAAFGADLGDAIAAQSAAAPKRRRRIRTSRVLLGAGALAVAGTVAVLVIGPSSPTERLDVIAEARAALAPKAGILHVRGVMVDESTSGGKAIGHAPGTARQRWEQWVAKDPGRWRVKTYASKRMVRRPGGVLRPAVEPVEVAFADGAESDYRPLNGRMDTVTGLGSRHGDQPLGLMSFAPGRSLDEIRTALGRGDLQDRGRTTVGGVAARRLVGVSADGHGTKTTVDYAVDATTFAPLRMTITLRHQRTGPRTGLRAMLLRWRMDFEVYEHLADTPANANVLKITPPPGTRIRSQTVEEARAQGKRREREELRRSRARARQEAAKKATP